MLSRKFKHQLETIWVLAKTDIKLRYQDSLLGMLWVFLKPLGLFLVLNFVFSAFFNRDPDYPIRLLTGIMLWSLFSDATMKGMTSLVNKASILKKVYMPKWQVVVSAVLHSGIVFLINLIVLFLFFFLYYRVYPQPLNILIFFFIVLEIYLISLIFSFLTATVFVRLRDLDQIWELLLQILFFATPIIYPIEIVPEQFRKFILFNPLTHILERARVVLIDQGSIDFRIDLVFFAVLSGLLVLSIFIFRKGSKLLVENM
jgi:ABC-type polysaccharide/polyol phosphate export permease